MYIQLCIFNYEYSTMYIQLCIFKMTEKKLTTNQELGETSYHKKEEKIVSIYERYCVQFYYYKNVF